MCNVKSIINVKENEEVLIVIEESNDNEKKKYVMA